MGHAFCCHTSCACPGTSGASTQLFKLVETDLMSKELTRYDSSDAQLLGLHSIQDVLSKLAAVSTTPSPSTPIVTAAVPPTAATQTSLEEPSDSTANMRQEKVLSAWGQVPRIAGANVEEAGEVMAPSANVCVLEAEEGMTKMAIKRTYQPSTLKRKRMHGFLYRSKSRLGKKILRRRLEKGRWRMGI